MASSHSKCIELTDFVVLAMKNQWSLDLFNRTWNVQVSSYIFLVFTLVITYFFFVIQVKTFLNHHLFVPKYAPLFSELIWHLFLRLSFSAHNLHYCHPRQSDVISCCHSSLCLPLCFYP